MQAKQPWWGHVREPFHNGVLCAVDADPQRDDHTVLADVDTVEQETDQIQLVISLAQSATGFWVKRNGSCDLSRCP